MPDVHASDVVAYFPTKPDLAQERRRAKDLLKAVRRGDDAAIARFRAHHPRLAELTLGEPTGHVKLSDAQWVIAREYGFASWSSLKTYIEQVSGRPPGVVPYSVVVWNDDTTPMEFVILLLKQVFRKSEQDAVRIMLDTHYAEFAVCAAFDRLEEAEAKRAEATALVRRHGHMLELTCACVDVAATTRLRRRVENSNKEEARARQVRCDDTAMYVELIDGRTLSAPLDWFPGLLLASPDQRRRCAVSDQGRELSWEFGARVSVSGLLAGRARETVIGPASRLSSLTPSALAPCRCPCDRSRTVTTHLQPATARTRPSPGRGRRPISATHSSLCTEAPRAPTPRRSRRRSRLIAPRLRSARASARHSTGQGFSALSASRSRCLADTGMIRP